MLQKKGHEIALRSKEFLDKYNIEFEMKKEVQNIKYHTIYAYSL